MAAATRLANLTARAACDAIVDRIDAGAGAGKLRIYDGSQPAGADVAVGAQTLLAEITLNDPAFGAAADGNPGGVATADVDPATEDTSADASGTASWFRVVDSDNNPVFDGSAGEAADSTDLTLDNKDLNAGQKVTITAWTFTQPES